MEFSLAEIALSESDILLDGSVSSQKSIQIGIASNVIHQSNSFEITPFTRFKRRHIPTDRAPADARGRSDATTSHAFESLALVTAARMPCHTVAHRNSVCRYVKYAMDTRMSLTDTALCTDSTRTRVDVDSELRARKADCDRVN